LVYERRKAFICGLIDTFSGNASKAAWVLAQFLQGKHFIFTGSRKKITGKHGERYPGNFFLTRRNF